MGLAVALLAAVTVASVANAQVEARPDVRITYFEWLEENGVSRYRIRDPGPGEPETVSVTALINTAADWMYVTECGTSSKDLQEALTLFSAAGVHFLTESPATNGCWGIAHFRPFARAAPEFLPVPLANFVAFATDSSSIGYAQLLESAQEVNPLALNASGVTASVRPSPITIVHQDGSSESYAGWTMAINHVEHSTLGATLLSPGIRLGDQSFEVELFVHEFMHVLGADHLGPSNFSSSSIMWASLGAASEHGGLHAGGAHWGSNTSDPVRNGLLAADRRYLVNQFSTAVPATSVDTRLYPFVKTIGFTQSGRLSASYIGPDRSASAINKPPPPQGLWACPNGPLEGTDVENLIDWMPQVDQIGPAASPPTVNFYARNVAVHHDRFSFVGAQPVDASILQGDLVDPVTPTNGIDEWYVDASAYDSVDKTYRIYAEVVGELGEVNSGEVATDFTFTVERQCEVDESPPGCCE